MSTAWWQAPESAGDESMVMVAVQTAELQGWAGLAERIMTEAALRVVSDVEEPQARAAIIMEHAHFIVNGVGQLTQSLGQAHRHAHAEAINVLGPLRSEATALRRDIAAMRMAESEARTEGAEEISALQKLRMALSREVTGLQAEHAEVRGQLRATWDYLHAISEGKEGESEDRERELPVMARRMCARLLEDEEDASMLRGRLAEVEATLQELQAQLREVPPPLPAAGLGRNREHQQQQMDPPLTAMLAVEAPRPTYERLLPAPAVNPVTVSLLRVRDQVRRLREPSLDATFPAVERTSQKDSGFVSADVDGGMLRSPPSQGSRPTDTTLFPRSVYMQSVTPLRAPLRCDSSALLEPDATPVTAWRDRMTELQSELRGLRRELGTQGVRNSNGISSVRPS